MKEVPREASRKLANEFLSNLKTALGKKRVKFDLKLIRRHSQLYRFCVRRKTHFFFIHANLGKEFFEMPSPWQEISHFISPDNMDWAVIFLKEPEGEKHPFGFFVSRDDFIKMKSDFTMNRLGLMKIRERDLLSKNQFMDWDTFFRLLSLPL